MLLANKTQHICGLGVISIAQLSFAKQLNQSLSLLHYNIDGKNSVFQKKN